MAYTLAIAVLMTASSAILAEGSLCDVYSNMPNMTTSHISCLPLTSSNAVSEEDKTLIVNNHNRVRNDITDATDMLKMSWDENLADTAQRWADSCVWDHPSMGDSYLWGYLSSGQNIARGQSSWQGAMNGWENEKDNFAFGVGSTNGGETLHYTQMIWSSTVKIGCGVKTCDGSSYYVCNYGPAGNYGNQPYVKGTAAADCQTADGNLCDCSGKVCKNYGTLNRGTCECICTGDDMSRYADNNCTLDCNSATDKWYCTNTYYAMSDCSSYANLAPQWCPHMCELCPAIANLTLL